MSIKILGGLARGQLLDVPKGDLIRPTSIMLRRRIYDFYQDLSGVTFVDLCAGSGAMAFEAWSRGARKVFVNEINKHVIKILEDNKEQILLKHSHKKCGEIICSHFPAEKWIKHFRLEYEKFSPEDQEETIIFLDPPYSEKNVYYEVVKFLKEDGWFRGQLWVESDPLKGLSIKEVEALGLRALKIYEQGDSFIFISNISPEN